MAPLPVHTLGRAPPFRTRVPPSPDERIPPRSKSQPGQQLTKAGNRTRTGDPHLGKVVLYQLSYSRTTGPEDPGKGPERPL